MLLASLGQQMATQGVMVEQGPQEIVVQQVLLGQQVEQEVRGPQDLLGLLAVQVEQVELVVLATQVGQG